AAGALGTPPARVLTISPRGASTPSAVVLELNVTLTRTGGFAGRGETFVLKPDGSIVSGKQIMKVEGGAATAAKLAGQLVATGIYSATPGSYLPDNPCCDRYTYDLTLSREGKSYSFVTIDYSPSAPPALLHAVT